MSKKGKKYLEERSKVEPGRRYSLREAVELAVSAARAKFDETADVAIKLGSIPSTRTR
jgi:large subunit ribosomal protein L1